MAAPDPPVVVVEAAAVPIDEPALGRRDEVAKRRDTVPERALRAPNIEAALTQSAASSSSTAAPGLSAFHVAT